MLEKNKKETELKMMKMVISVSNLNNFLIIFLCLDSDDSLFLRNTENLLCHRTYSNFENL